MSAQRSDALVDAKGAAPHFGCCPKHFVDRVSKQPGFPQPIKWRPLVWVEAKVLAFRDR